ncbi:unnamed protein product [Spirodela intermedia]|uniref:Rhamnogalacturonase A/B/Epimerase-like pectate lyase domain-containing protein n=1 Tax=Spirodela intermedia TaxID=51605 RepID=A0A7I8IW46_SPIIN|nr:unnamed protein product [Spirodela intermedia]CAA6662217.1 unnamed protein product [Spirodela intermedia]
MRRFSTLLSALLIAAAIHEARWAAASCRRAKSDPVRPHSVSITEFGAVGDGVTLNTKAFQNAIFYLHSFADKGGAQLFVPAGKWLTGSFSLISHLTLSLDKDAVILGSKDPSDWPIVDPLPSYGQGKDLPRGRHQSLIFGSHLTDVVITGGNGTVDGQGGVWWEWARNHILNFTRPHLVELMHSTAVVISDLTFKNSPFWAIHPVYCSQVLIQNITILAAPDSPNTDGIDPDSSCNVCIKDCYISTGDDLIVVKSGWDDHGGAATARPSFNITITQITGSGGGGITLGSETSSGGISDIRADGLRLSNSKSGIAIRAAATGGGYIRNILISGVTMTNVETAFSITIRDVVGENIKQAGIVEGIEGGSLRDICFSNIALNNVRSEPPWRCSYSEGYSDRVSPEPCPPLRNPIPINSSVCYWLDRWRRAQPLNGSRLISALVEFAPFAG